MNLPAQPKAPEGVKYALTVPQSVLFADLSLQGNLRKYFKTAMQIDYEPLYISIDTGGAMSWNHDSDNEFLRALRGGSVAQASSDTQAIGKYIDAMDSTARAIDKVSRTVPPAVNRRKGKADDILNDLEEYWYAYKLHMTSLFTFWNAEYLLSTALADHMRKLQRLDDLRQGLARYLKPFENNYFLLEQKQLRRIVRRFLGPNPQDRMKSLTEGTAPDGLVEALRNHSRTFGFLLAPFNLGAPPSVQALLAHIPEVLEASQEAHDNELVEFSTDWMDDLPPETRLLGTLAQRFTFWKTERLDVLSLGDVRAHPLYEEAAAILDLPLDHLFSMTADEISQSLKQGSPVVDEEVRYARIERYCLILHNGDISFYEPSSGKQTETAEDVLALVGTTLHGVGASPGTVIGRAKVITSLSEVDQVRVGDILVTTMTRPEMGTALVRAAAFVTDEGGRLSHAAIISREMGKPCVIGTNNATRVIRSGMVLNVDGSKGSVTIIQTAE